MPPFFVCKASPGLRVSILTHYDVGMIDYRDWYKSATGQRVTAETIGKLIGASRPTVTRRLTQDGLTADEIIKVSRGLRVNPVDALVDLGHITESEAMSHLDSDGALIATAEDGDLALELARRLNPATRANELDELAARRTATPVSDTSDSMPLSAVAYSGPDEDAERNDAYDD